MKIELFENFNKMKIELFENFNERFFKGISYDEFHEKLITRDRETWTEAEIEKIERLFEVVVAKNLKIKCFIPLKTFVKIEISDEKANLLFEIYIIKQEDEWFMLQLHISKGSFRSQHDWRETLSSVPTKFKERNPPGIWGSFECDQFSGLEECIKQLFTK
jgi:hypothetical protein